MGAETKIQWCDHTFNIAWGCTKVSEGCTNCYAESTAKYRGQDVWGPDKPRRVMSDAYWNDLLKWNRVAERNGQRARVFCSSMADVFEDHPMMPAARERLWPLIVQCEWLDFLLLTKRPQNMQAMLPPEWILNPRPNVWLGATCENQQRYDERILHLLATPAAVRFVSYEPAVGPIDFSLAGTLPKDIAQRYTALYERLDWVIVGGESGAGARVRPFDLAWARSAIQQCADFGVACFVKQLGARPIQSDDDARRFGALLKQAHPKGGDATEWPPDLRVRQWPDPRDGRHGGDSPFHVPR